MKKNQIVIILYCLILYGLIICLKNWHRSGDSISIYIPKNATIQLNALTDNNFIMMSFDDDSCDITLNPYLDKPGDISQMTSRKVKITSDMKMKVRELTIKGINVIGIDKGNSIGKTKPITFFSVKFGDLKGSLEASCWKGKEDLRPEQIKIHQEILDIYNELPK